MGNTYIQNYQHIVFSTYDREPIIRDKYKIRLHKYINAIINENKSKPLITNSHLNHIHILLSLNSYISTAEIVKIIKTSSSKWINKNNFIPGKFKWQNGYASFSVSQSRLNKVYKYIEEQESHHKRKDFNSEYGDLLKAHGLLRT